MAETDRAPYRVAADAGRESFARARRARCSLEEHVVLEAVVSLTALESKLAEDVAVAVIAERAGVHPKNAARSLGRLRDLGVIDYRAGRGRGNVSRVGLPAAGTEAVDAPISEAEKGSRSAAAPEIGADLKRESPPPAGIEHAANAGKLRRESGEVVTAVQESREIVAGESAELSPEEALAADVLSVFNQRADTAYRFEEWGAQVTARVRERPEWTLDDWRDTIRRAFAVAWWERKLPPGEVPTPAVIFSSARQVDSTSNVPERVVERAERVRAAARST